MDVNRKQIIEAMCITWRHDFELDKRHTFFGYSGMTPNERDALRGQMSQLYDHHIAPLVQACANLSVGVPDAIPMEPFQTVDRSSANYKAGWNACRKAMLAAASAAPTVKAERVPCATCQGSSMVDDGEITCSEGGIPYENGPVKCVKDCPYCTVRSPSLPAAGSAVESWCDQLQREFPNSEPEHWPDSLTIPAMGREIRELRAALSAQQSAPERVSVPRELLKSILSLGVLVPFEIRRELRALLSRNGNGGEA